MIRTYSELITIPTFIERFNYLKIGGTVGRSTFGSDRYLNQVLYSSMDWKKARDLVLVRDSGLDLGCEGHEIQKHIYVHHMNPITIGDIINRNPDIFDPEYLISSAYYTHEAIHFSDESLLESYSVIERRPNDTTPWRR